MNYRHPPMQRRFVQILGYLVIAGLVVVLAGVAGFGPLSGFKKDDAPEATNSTSDEGSVALGSFKSGECATWDQSSAEGRKVSVVPCSEPHLIEMAGKASAKEFDHYPTEKEWAAFRATKCAALVERHLAIKLDPYGRFRPASLHPLPPAWNVGNREVWCGVASNPPGGPTRANDLTAFRGKVSAASQEQPAAVGTCWNAGSTVASSCAKPHTWQVVGHTKLPEGTPPPAAEDAANWRRLVGEACNAAFRAFTGRSPSEKEAAGWVPIARVSWDVGARTIECTGSRSENGRVVATTGSLEG
jgi:hypothetical protein